MKNTFLVAMLALLLLPVSGALAQHHFGLGAEIIAPLSPLSKGYGVGYSFSANYRHFKMTKMLILDASIGYSSINSTQDTIYEYDNFGGYYIEHAPSDIKAIFVKGGIAWAFMPNASPYTQPYAGAELGISMGKRLGSQYRSVPMALRLGWMSYINERYLLGFEAKYNLQHQLDPRYDATFTAVKGSLDMFLSFQLSATIKLGR